MQHQAAMKTKERLVLCAFCICILLIVFIKLEFKFFSTDSNKFGKKPKLRSCLNEVYIEHNISVFTLLTDDQNYALSSIKLLKSIKANTDNIEFDKIVLELYEKPLKNSIKKILLNQGWKICQVNRIAPGDEEATHPRFRDQFTKLILLTMTEYEAIIYFDSDTFVIRNINSLLNVHKTLKATGLKIACTRDIREGVWQETFNLGVFSLIPNRTEFNRLMQLKNDKNFEYEKIMSEQGFLNNVYKGQWLDFGFKNNANMAVYSSDREYWKQQEKDIAVIHYTMSKPWDCPDLYKEICDPWKNL